MGRPLRERFCKMCGKRLINRRTTAKYCKPCVRSDKYLELIYHKAEQRRMK